MITLTARQGVVLTGGLLQTIILGGVRLLISGIWVLVNVRRRGEVVAALGKELKTVMLSGWLPVKSLAGMAAFSWVVLMNVVGRGLPLTWTTELEANPLPVKPSVNPALPVVTRDGLIRLRTGGGTRFAAAEPHRDESTVLHALITMLCCVATLAGAV